IPIMESIHNRRARNKKLMLVAKIPIMESIHNPSVGFFPLTSIETTSSREKASSVGTGPK
ncbi:MAG: hypothetical protein RMM53_14040, partial [Bacteroidia bacterium]|nr:hypothetical protein [Bacteroidia bacterium]